MDLDVSILWLAVAVVAGALAGSLIHTISLRLPAGMTPFGQPICYSCHGLLPWSASLPFLTMRCPTCGITTNWHKPATEVAAIAVVVLSLMSHGLTFHGLVVALFTLILLLILRIDWQHHLIYTVIIVFGSLLALGLALIESLGAFLSALVAATGAALLFGLFYALALFIYRRRALGRGDILLAFLIGAMTGVDLVVVALLVGMSLAAFGGLFLIAIGKRTRNDYIPYGAYLCLGAIIVLLLPT